MLFSTHIDVFKSCLGPLKCHLHYIFNYTLKIIDILLKVSFDKIFTMCLTSEYMYLKEH